MGQHATTKHDLERTWKDRNRRGKPTRKHEPKPAYDRHDQRWVEEEVYEYGEDYGQVCTPTEEP
jgi:hypothetical protein